MKPLNSIDRRLIELLQEEFPRVPRPFSVLAERLEQGESEIIERTRDLCRRGIIREISAVLNARKLGYKTTLVAVDVEEEMIETVAQAVSSDPRVSHNYLRQSEFPLWFTFSVSLEEQFEEALADFLRLSGVRSYIILPAVKLYKLDVRFSFRERRGNDAPDPIRPDSGLYLPSQKEASLLEALQETFEICSDPWDNAASRAGVSRKELFTLVEKLEREKVIKKIGAVIRHYAIGLDGTCMVCFDLSESAVDSAGRRLAEYPEISHCIRRNRYDQWPYNLYAVVHSPSREESEKLIEFMADRIKCADYRILFADHEYKKERVKYAVERKGN